MRIHTRVRVGKFATVVTLATLALLTISGAAGIAQAGGPYASYTLDAPCRLYDTREHGALNRHYDQQERGYRVQGACGVPLGAAAAMLNVTVVGATGDGYLVVWKAGAGRPATANINFSAGATVGNSMTVQLGAGNAPAGEFLVDMMTYTVVGLPRGAEPGEGSVDVVIDVVGYLL